MTRENYRQVTGMIDENFILSASQVEQYLQRLGLDYKQDKNRLIPSEENLKYLQTIHISKIPYENLSILLGEPISLNGKDLFIKIISNNRGGYCFEVNGLYTFLLKALGYKVTVYNVRFISENKGVQMRRHRIMRVEIDGISYITDVSFRNEYPRTALRFICGKVQTDGISEYKFTQDEYYGYIMWQKRTGKEWSKIFGFDESPQSEIDFLLPNYYCETHPDSPFIDAPHMSICPIDQHITMAGREFTISKKNKILVKRNIETNEEFILLCKTYFGIEINEEKADVIMRKTRHKS